MKLASYTKMPKNSISSQNSTHDFQDGMEEVDAWNIYYSATKKYWDKYPVFLLAGYQIIWSESQSIAMMIKSIITIIVKVAEPIFKQKRGGIKIPQCDVLLFHSTYKPNCQPALDIMAQRLAENGVRCIVMNSGKKLTVWEKNEATLKVESNVISNYKSWIKGSIGFYDSLRIFFKSLWQSARLRMILFRADSYSGGLFHANFAQITQNILSSYHRQIIVADILEHIKPKFILITVERVPYGTELSLSKQAANAHKVLYLNENPLISMLPINSDEAWVWSNSVIEAFTNISKDELLPSFNIVGNSESDLVFEPETFHGEIETNLQNQCMGKPVFLFLMEYYPSDYTDLSKISFEAHRWISYVAEALPGWHFILKTRPFKGNVSIPGEAMLDLDNITVSRGGVDLNQFLRWDTLKAVGGCNTTGLYITARAGKIACRFMISSKQRALPVTDEVSVLINSPDELLNMLKNLDEKANTSPPMNDIPSDVNKIFPYRGETIQRMVDLCLRRLNGDLSVN